MQSDQPILVIGAGIGGLALALGLQRAGRKVSVYEAAQSPGEIGAGLTISPNATHALDYLGLGQLLADRGDRPLHGYAMYTHTGELLYDAPLETSFKERHGADLYQIHRVDLHNGLIDAVRANDSAAIVTDRALVGLSQTADGVTARFADGSSARGAGLIGCDGVRSAVRQALFGPDAPLFTGQVAYRGLVPAERLPQLAARRGSAAFVGLGRTFTRYFLRHRTLINYVGIVRTPILEEESGMTPASVGGLLEAYEGWHEEVRATIAATPADRLFKWSLFDRDPLPRWTVERATLLGDAAHPMLPFLGMGAAMALEDAAVLSRCVGAAPDLGEAFVRYEAARAERTRMVLLESRRQGQIYQSDVTDQTSRLDMPGELRLGLYDYDPRTVRI